MNAYNDPAAIRARYEAAGFNPLLGIAPGVDLQTTPGGSNFMGEALADVSLQLGEMAARPRAVMSIGKMNNLAAQDARLAEENRTLRLQPGGATLYERGGPSVRGSPAMGGSRASGPAGAPLDGNGPQSGFGPARPVAAPSVDPDTGKLAGIWVDGAFVQRPPGYSTDDAIEMELGDSLLAEVAVLPLGAAYDRAASEALARQAKLRIVNRNSGGRATGSDIGNIAYVARNPGPKTIRIKGANAPTDVGGMSSELPSLNGSVAQIG